MKCDCGNEFEGRFCNNCGKSKEEILQSRKSDKVKCRCGNEFEGKFCPVCGEMRPQNRSVNVDNNNQNAVSLEKRNINAGNSYQNTASPPDNSFNSGNNYQNNFQPQNRNINAGNNYQNNFQPQDRNINAGNSYNNTASQPNNSFNSGNSYQNTVPPQGITGNQVLTIQKPRTLKDWFKSGLSKAFFLNFILGFLNFFIFGDIISGCICLFSAILGSPLLYIKFDLFSDRNLTKKERKQLNIVIIILNVVAGWFFEAGISAFGTLIIYFWLLYLLSKNLSKKQWKVTKIVMVFVVLGVIVASGYQMAENQKQQNQQITTYDTDTVTADATAAPSKVELYTENATDSNNNSDIIEFYLGETLKFEDKNIVFNNIYIKDDTFVGIVLYCDIQFTNTSDKNIVFDTGDLGISAYNDGVWDNIAFCDYNNTTISPGKTFDTVIEFYLPENANTDVSKVAVSCGNNAVVYPYHKN